jgi:glycerol-3-phosphate dehydrogenase (NAD(P)+)
VAGAGSWGTAFTRVLLDRGHEVVLACRSREQAETVAATGWNPDYLQGVDLRGAEAVALADAPGDADVVVVAVPSKAFAEVVEALPGDAPVLSLVKGLDPESGERLSTRVRGRAVAVLSGPNIAEEIAAGLPTAAVIASDDSFLAGQLQHAINSLVFRAYVNPDLVGVELCAAAKNVIALAAGGVDGLRLGDNAKASLIAREDPQPAGGRADRAGPHVRAGGRRDRPDGRGPDDGADPARPLAPARSRAADHRRRLRRPRGPEHHRPRRRPDGTGTDGGVRRLR